MLGSFANVCIWRIPQDMSVVKPRSFCPNCKKAIPWYYNLPVLSYVYLRGKCAYCKTRISIRYPIIELMTGVLTASWFIKFGYSPAMYIFAVFGFILIVLSGIDAEHFIGLVILIIRLLGTLAFKKEAMGIGDIKLMMGIGAFTGFFSLFWIIFIASIFGSIVGITAIVMHKKDKLEYLPFGPYLALGSIFYVHLSELIDKFIFLYY
jgi:leader peptidase (prepilin peptidase)/N-methyltransferase